MGRFDKECKEAEGSKQGIMQLNVTLLIVEEKRESKLKSTAFQLLKQYQHYREDKKIRNLQLYQWQDRKTATKAMRGLRRYHNMLGSIRPLFRQVWRITAAGLLSSSNVEMF